MDICPLCRRTTEQYTKHHLIPKCRNKKTKSKGGSILEPLCTDCHKQIHALFTEKELAKDYNTLEKLQKHPQMRQFLNWAKKHPNGTIKVRMSKRIKPHFR